MSRGAGPNLLEAILAATRRRVALAAKRAPAAALETLALARTPRGDRFRAGVSAPGGVNVIAECKRRSPSRGVLRAEYDAVAIARAYERAGAAAISVLTEPAFFDGALEHLAQVRGAVQVPLLRKDFLIDEYQLLEARASGADAVLLIVAALTDAELRTLHQHARSLELEALVEVHDVDELERAIGAGAAIIGVNNRNLRTLAVDTQVSERIAARLPRGVIAISESGLGTRDDLVRLQAMGYSAFLIGERFMTSRDPGEALAAVLALAAEPARPVSDAS